MAYRQTNREHREGRNENGNGPKALAQETPRLLPTNILRKPLQSPPMERIKR